jgi:hypothetical protein
VKGYFVSFDYTLDAEQEVRRFKKQTGKEIVLLKVGELLEDQNVVERIPPSPVRASDLSIRKSRATT